MKPTVGIRRRSNRVALFAIALGAGALVLAACGGDSDSDSGSSAGEGATEASGASGEPIKLMTIGPVDAPGFSLPSLPVGAEVAIDEINSDGGINGRPLELITCNDENNPNVAAQCAKQAIDEDVVAVVGGLSIFDLSAIPALQQAGIPWVGLTTPDAFDQDGVYLIGGDGASTFTAIGASLAQQGCENIAIVLGAQTPDVAATQIEAGILDEGAEVAATLKATGTDWAPTVEAARSAGADCIAAGTGPPETGPLLAAVNAGEALPVAVADGGLPDVVLSELGADADGVLTMSGFLPNSSEEGIVQELGSKVREAAPGIPYDQFAKTGYASVQIVREAAQDLDEVTAASLSDALSEVTDFDTGFGPVVDLSEPNSIPGFERIFNPKIYVLRATDGEYELAELEPIDMTGALQILSEG